MSFGELFLAFRRILVCPWLQHRCESLMSENLCWICGLNRLRTGELPAVGFIDCEPGSHVHVTWYGRIAERNRSVEQSLVTIISHPMLYSNGLWFTRLCRVYWPSSKMVSPTCGADSLQLPLHGTVSCLKVISDGLYPQTYLSWRCVALLSHTL